MRRCFSMLSASRSSCPAMASSGTANFFLHSVIRAPSSFCFARTVSVGSRTGAILERAGFQPPPQQTQRADFPHWAFLCASRQGLCGFFVLVDFQLLALYTTR